MTSEARPDRLLPSVAAPSLVDAVGVLPGVTAWLLQRRGSAAPGT